MDPRTRNVWSWSLLVQLSQMIRITDSFPGYLSCPYAARCIPNSVPQPSSPFLLLLLPSLVLERLYFLSAQLLATSLCLQALPIMTISGGIYIKEGIHLSPTLVLVIALFWEIGRAHV